MKKYVKPEMKIYIMEAESILDGSASINTKVGVSSFFTDEDDTKNT